jgi:integrase
MIVFEGKRYRGVTSRRGAFIFRYTDAEGREHRHKYQTLDDALVQYHEKKARAKRGEKMPSPGVLRRNRLTVGEILRDAVAYSKERKRSYQTDLPRFKLLGKLLGKNLAESLTPKEIESTLNRVAEDERWAASTFNHYRSLISLAYRLAIRDRGLTLNPARSVSHRREDNSRVRFLSQDEEERFRNVVAGKYSWHLPELELALQTGIRQGSQYSLTWEMVDWQMHMLNIPRTKNEEPLHVPVNDVALTALKTVRARGDREGRIFLSQRSGQPLQHPRHWFEPALIEAKISGFHWHDLRHTFASRLRMAGTALEDIADLLGHKSLMMTKRYAHLGPSRLHEVVARLSGMKPKSGTQTGTSLNEHAARSVISFLN